jgi:hypothetical protein
MLVLLGVVFVWMAIAVVFLAACLIAGRADRGMVAAAAPPSDDPVIRLVGTQLG